MKNQMEFRDKVVLVTGAAAGIGRASALAFAKEGAKVVVSDVSESGIGVAREIEAMGQKAIFVHCDVSDETQVRDMVNKTIEVFGRLDCAFNNAGIEGSQAMTVECETSNWDRVMSINLKGAWLCMKFEIPQMLKQGSGSIVNCSSVAGLIGFQGIPAYVASKHGLIGLTKATALEYAKANIRVNAICPGVIETAMIDRFTHGNAEALTQLVSNEPIGRMGQPQEVADAVLWLCSKDSSFVTGHALAVDGGWVAG